MKTCAALYAEMKQHYCEKTGFSMTDTADLAVRLYACAAQLESLYRYADWCVAQAFPQTAVGDVATIYGDDLALQAAELDHTIVYELLCDVAPRVPRIYFQQGAPLPG